MILPLAGFGLIGIGFIHCRGLVTIGGYIYYRAGVAVIAAGIAMLGYWALANKNDNYNF